MRIKTMDNKDTILFMTLGMVMMLAAMLDILTQVMPHPFLTVLLGITGLVTFWIPMIMTSLDD
tara:strand:- start:318 stop:506 length:189 start_codon:yes stop_codon:yes gene_type:complete